MLSQALTTSTDMYKENSCILALIEDKAQKAATIAGVFLAAALAFLEKTPSKIHLVFWGGRALCFWGLRSS